MKNHMKIQFDFGTAYKITHGETEGKIVTRSGKNVRIICFDFKNDSYPIVGLLQKPDGNENLILYDIYGISYGMDSSLDLMLDVPVHNTFNDGDIIVYGNIDDSLHIGIFKEYVSYDTSHNGYVSFSPYTNELTYCYHNHTLNNSRIATNEEKRKLINALKSNKNLNAKEYLKRFFDEKEILCICETTNNNILMTPFKKVLVRNKNDEEWKADIFYKIDKNGIYHCIGGDWKICIIYDGNESLL